MLLLSYLTRAMHLSLSVSLVSRGLCLSAMQSPPPWMVRDRSAGHIVDLDRFFKNEATSTRLLLLGSNAADIPPAPVVRMGQQHEWTFVFPTSLNDEDAQRVVTGSSKRSRSHQRRYAYLYPQEYTKLCKQEDAVALELSRLVHEKPRVVAIVPTAFLVHDSLPSRLQKLGVWPRTVSVGEGGYQGEFIVVRAPSCNTSV